MRRHFRPSASGTFSTGAVSSLFRLGAFLIVLALLYSWARKPQTWRWLESGSESLSEADEPDPVTENRKKVVGGEAARNPDAATKRASAEVVVPGPTDQNEAEAAEAKNLFQALSDRAPLSDIEMPAYWRCLKWAGAQSFAELEQRALRRIVYTQLWEQPDKYRGKLIRLRLHVRRILDWDAPKNSAGVRRVYEAWGWTDESKSFPYVVVFADAPEGTPLGDNLDEEGIFVGYFLKTIAYTASNRNRSSPLLLGRMKWLNSAAPPRPIVGRKDWIWIVAIGIPAVALIGWGAWFQMRRYRRVKLSPATPADEAEIENWFRNESTSLPARDASDEPPAQSQ
jgi:hypothetical protein